MASDSPEIEAIPVVILCGGRGTRLGETTQLRPKPLVEVGGRPILWHVMASYARYGFRNFILCLGYKGGMIEHYFHEQPAPPGWNIHFAETGPDTMTGGRLHRVRHLITADRFMLTYADGLSDVNIPELLTFHTKHGGLATVTGVRPPSQFGFLALNGDRVARFAEKPKPDSYINGGFFVFDRKFLDLVDAADSCILEREPLEHAANAGQLRAYRHDGFWQCMDTPKDWEFLNALYRTGRAVWLPELPAPATTTQVGASLAFHPTNIPGGHVVESILRADERGWFGRVYCVDAFTEMHLETSYVQQNHSQSKRKGTIRGLHYQLPPHSEAKLVRCTRGAVVDVMVDVRANSPTFLKWHAEVLTPDNRKLVYVPPGCAHGFQALEDNSEITYPVTSRYAPRHERGIRYDDPRIGIAWPITGDAVIISDKDRTQPLLDASFHGVEL